MSFFTSKPKSVARANRYAGDDFVLEMMEPRILLSGAPVDLPQPVVTMATPPPPAASVDHVVMMIPSSTALTADITATPSAALTHSVFGETQALPAASESTQEPLAPESAAKTAQLDTVKASTESDKKAVDPLLPTSLNAGLSDSKAVPASNTMSGELVDTLHAANGPPATVAAASDVTNGSKSTTYQNNGTGATSGLLSVPTQLIIIDGAVNGFSPLIQGLQSGNSNTQVVVLDTQSNGIQQITDLLKSYHNLDAIQILAHGGDGALRLGNLVLNDAKLAENSQSIASWGTALKTGGAILLYGCDVAQSAKGAQFVSDLAHITGANVAASTNATGAASVGGDWILEYQTGPIDVGVPFVPAAMAAYNSLLDSLPSVTLSSGDTTSVTVGSTVTVGIGGTNYSTLTVSGTAALNGTLAVSVSNGFTLSAGQTFDVLTAGNVTGTFTNATGLFNNGNLYFDIVQTASKLQLVVKEVPGSPSGSASLLISSGVQAVRDALGQDFGSYFTSPPAVSASLNLSISGFATLSGSFGVQKTGNLISLVAQNASALLSSGTASAGISSANLAVLLNTNGTRVVYGSGQFAISAGSSFVNASGTVTLTENTTASATTNQTVTVSGVSVNMPAIAAGVQSLSGTGLSVDVNGFASLTGDFGFKKGAGGLEVVANNASALLNTSSASVGVKNATLGLLLPSAGGVALSASGATVLTLPTAFGSVGASSIGVNFNSTGAAVSQTLTSNGISQALNLPTGSIATPYSAVTVTGFTASIADFVTLAGNFGFQKSGSDLLVAATNASATLVVGGTVNAGLTGATIGLIIKADQTFALQSTGGAVSLNLGSGFARATASSINIAYNNTSADVNTTVSVSAGVATVSAGVNVVKGANAISVTGLDATVSNFVHITGNFGMLKNGGDLIVASSNASAVLESGAMKVGVSGVTLGLIVKPNFTLALQASGAAQMILGTGFATASATSASISYNNTTADVNRTVAVVIGSTSVSAPVVVANGVTSVTASGVLATLVDFVTFSGTFAFQTSGADIIAAATGAAASLSVSTVVHAGLSNATIGLLLKSDGTLAIDGSGAVDINLGPSFGSANATSVTLKYNNTGADVARTLTIGAVSAPLNALNNVSVVTALGFNATINNFVTVTGDLGFKKTSDGLVVVGQNVDARLAVGSVLAVGITSGNLGMIINSANRVVLEADGGLVLNLGSGSFTVGTVTADKVKVEFNNTGADVNTTVTVGSLSQVINVKKSTISVSAFNFHAQILNFIDISGDLSFKKLTLGDFNLPNFPSLPTWDPSLPNVNLPTIPDLGGVNLPTLPGLPGLPAWPTANLPDFPELNLAGLPSLPTLSGLPNLGDFGLGGFSIAGLNMGINLSIPGFSIGTINADFGLLMDSFGKFALDIHGLPSFSVGLADIGKIGAHDVEVKFNNTSVDVNGSANDVNGNAKSVQVAKGLAQVNIDGFYAILNNVVQFNGDFGFQLGANRTELIGVGQNISSQLLPTTPASLINVGITGGTMAMVVKKGATLTDKPTIAVNAAGTLNASLGGDLTSVSATSAGVSFNNTGADEDRSLTVGSITQSLKAKAGITAVTATGFKATLNGIGTVSGNFAFISGTAADTYEIAATNVSASLNAGSVVKVGVSGATLAAVLNTNTGKLALQTTGGVSSINLGNGFSNPTATVGLVYNSTGTAVTKTISATTTDGAVTASLNNVQPGVTAVTLTSFVAVVQDFVTITGDFGAKISTVGSTQVIDIVGGNVSAELKLSTALKVGVTGATIGLSIDENQKFALQTTGGSLSFSLGSGFVTGPTASSVNVSYNNTGADVSRTLSVITGATTLSAAVNVLNGVSSVSVIGLNASIANFVTLAGDFGFRRNSANDEIQVVANGAGASLTTGALSVGVTNGTLGMVVTSAGKIALQASGTTSLSLGSGFITPTVNSLSVSYNNTGADVNRTVSVTVGASTLSAPVNVLNGVTAVVANGLNAQVANFVTLSGNFAFQTSGADIIAAATGAAASMSVSSVVHAGLSNATIGLLLKSNGTLAIDGSGAVDINLGPSFGTNVNASSVTVKYNNTGADVARTLTIGSVSAPLNALNNVSVVSAAGFNATINNFVTVTGDLGFKKTSDGLVVVGQNVDARLAVGSVLAVGITSGNLGMIINSANRVVLEADGGLVLNLGSGSFTVGTVTADKVKVEFNNTGADVNTTVTVGSLSQVINVNKSTISVSAFNFHAQILNFIDISGDLSFKKLTLGDFNLPNFPSLPTWDPSLPNVNLPTIPDLGGVNLPTLPGLPGLPAWPTANLPDFPELNLAGLPSLPSLPSLPNLGDFGLGGFSIAGLNMGINLSIPGFSIGTINADFGLLMDSFGKFALDIHGLPSFSVGLADIGKIGAHDVEVKFNNTSVDVNGSANDVNGNAKSVQVAKGLAQVNIDGFYAVLNNVFQINGDFGFQLGANRTELVGVGQNISAKLLPTTSSSVIDLGITGGTMAMVVKKGATLTDKPTIAVSADGKFNASIGGGLVGVSATSAGISFNNTGVDEDRSFTVGSITQSLKAKAGVTALTATSLSATIDQFVTLSGNFAFQQSTGGDINVIANGASATLTAGSQSIGVNGATLGMILKADGKIAMQASGQRAMNLDTSFVGVSAKSVTVAYNNTGADVNTTLTTGAVSAAINVTNNTTAITATGFVATISQFVTVSGDFSFKKTTDGDIIVAAAGASATLTAGNSLFIGVSAATLGLLIKSDGTLALQASGAFAMNLGSGLVGATATKVTVVYNNTGSDVALTAVVGAVSAPINVHNGVTAVTATGFNATIANFVTLTGDFGFQKSASGDLLVVAQNAGASLTAGSLSVGVTGASLGLIIKSAGTLALQASGPLNLNLGTSFGNVSATSVSVAYNNTGADVNTTVVVGTLSSPVVVQNNTTAVSVIGLNATITNFVTLKGDFGFLKTSGGDFAVAANGATATLTAGSVQVGVDSATFGMIVKSGGGIALQASGTPVLSLSSNFGNISATGVTVTYNNTGADVNTSVTIGSIVAPIVVANGTTAISVAGFSATVLNFVKISGNFGFKKTSAGDIIIAGSGASATLTSGSYAVGVTNATLGLILQSGGGTIFQASGSPLLNLPVSLGGVSANTVSVLYNNTATAVNTTITIGSITATVNVAANTTAVSVQGFQASISNFVTLSGDFGFSKTDGGDLAVVVNGASATLTAVGLTVGVTNATMAMLVKSDGTLAIQASGTPVLTLPSDVTSIIDLKVTDLQVSYNSTGAALNTSLSIGSLSAPLNVATGNSANPYLSIAGSGSLNIAGLVTVSGTFGFSKIVDAASNTTKVLVGASNVQGQANSNAYGVTGGTLGLALFRKTSTNTSLGYALDGSLTGFAQGGSSSAQATINIRRNTTTFAVNELAPVLATNAPIVFSATEVAKNGTPFNSISLADAVIKIGDITVKGSYTSQPNGPSGESITTITKASLVFGDPTLFTLTADSVTYKSYTSSVTLGGVTYADGVQQVIVTNGQIQLGDVVTLFGSFNIVRSKSAGTTLTNVGFTGLGISLKVDGRVMVTVAGDGMFHYGGADGFKLDTFLPTTFDILPDRQSGSTLTTAAAISEPGAPAVTDAPAATTTSSSPPKTITLGPLTLTNPHVTFTNFGLGFSNGQIVFKTTVTIGVESATLLSSGGSGAKITDSSDADKFGIAGSFEMDVLLDPANNFKPSGVNTGSFQLTVDHFELDFGTFLIFTADNFTFNPDASSTDVMFHFGSIAAAINAGPLAIGGGASDFSILGDGTFVAGANFAVTLTLGSDTDATSTFKTPAWMPLKNLRVTLRWENNNFTNDPSKFLIVLDADVASIKGMSGVSVTGGFKGLTIDVAKLAAGEFAILSIDSFNVGISGEAFGGEISASLVMGVVKLDSNYNIIESGSSTPVARRFFYGGIQGGITLAGLGKVDMRLGFSDFGPLSFFISASIPIVIDAASGLTIDNLRGGVDFGAKLSDPTVYEKNSQGETVIDPTTGVAKIDAQASAFGLRALKLANNPSDMTSTAWENSLRQQIATIMKNGGGSTVSFDDLAKNIVIHAGATLYTSYTSKFVFRADVDLSIDTTGKILLTGTATFNDTMTMDAYFYADLTKVASGSARFLFLFDDPGMPDRNLGGLSLYGLLDIGLVDSTGKRLAAADLQDKYFVTKTTRDTFTWNASTSSTLMLEHTPLTKGADFTVIVGTRPLASSEYTLSNGNTITLTTAPTDGEKIAVDYSYKDFYGIDANGNPIANPASQTPEPDGFQILIAGGLRADVLDNTLFVQLSGQLTMTFTSTQFTIDVSAELEVSILGVVGAAAGRLVIQYEPFAIWGALKLASGDGLRKLEDYGIKIQAQITITINTTKEEKQLDMQLPATKQAHTTDTFKLAAGDSPTLYMSHSRLAGGSLTVKDGGTTLVEGTDYDFDPANSIITLRDINDTTLATKNARTITAEYDSEDYLALHVKAKPESLNVVATVLATFSVGDTEFFRMQAGLSMTISNEGFSLILVGKLMIGPAGDPFLKFDTTALVYAGLIDGKFGFAAMFKVSLDVGLGPFGIKADVLVQTNTFGKTVVFNIPNVNPAFPTITDENGQSIEKTVQQTTVLHNSDGTVRLDANGNPMTTTVTARTVSISGGAPRLQGGFEADAPYFMLRGKGTLNLIDSEVSGQFYISLTPTKFRINVSGEMTYLIVNKFLVAGDLTLVYGPGKFYAYGGLLATRKTGNGDPLEVFGVYLSATGIIVLNTDSEAHTINLFIPGNGAATDITIDKSLVEFRAKASVSFRVAGTELFRIEGAVIIGISTDPVGTRLLIEGDLKIGADNPLFVFKANAAIYVGALPSGKGGFAAMIHVTLDSSFLPGVKISGGFLFMANTFGEDVNFSLGEVNDPAFTMPTIVDENNKSIETTVSRNGKTYRQVTITGGAPNLSGSFEDPGPYVLVRGKGEVNILDSFTFNGGFGILLTPTKFQLSVNASINLGPFGDVDAEGFMEISSNGIVGAFSLTVDTGKFGQAIGLKFDASFTFAVNTLGEKRTVTFLDGSKMEIDTGVRIQVDGTITFAGVLDADAHVAISFSNNKFQLDGTASINIAGGLIKSSIDIHVIVDDNGFALVTDIDVNTTLAGIIKITASGHLYINTGSNSVTLGGVTLDAKSVFFKLNGKLALLDIFKFDVTVTAQVGGTFQRPGLDDRHLDVGQWAFSFNASVNFYDLATVSIGGWIMYDGSFGVSLSGGILLGSKYLGFGLDMSASISYDAPTDDLHFSASVTGTVYILGFSASISLNFDYDSSSGEITLSASASGSDDGKHTTTHSHGWTIGYLTKPVPVYLATDNKGNRLSDGASVGASGELDLTMGDGAKRNYLPNVQDDTYMVNHVSTQSDGSETVRVSFAGRSAEYSGVRKIVSHGGPGNETLYIQDGVKSQLQLDLGGGNDTIMVSGGSTTLTNTINGGDGNDLITISAGNTRSYTISGGAGINTLNGGNGNDTFYAGPGTDYITGGLGADTIYSGTGHAYILADNGTISKADGSSAPLSMTSSGAGGDDTIYATTGTNFIIGGQGKDKVFGGADNVIIGDDGEIDFDSSGNVITAISTGSTGGNDYIDSLGGTGSSIILAGAGSDTIKGGDGTNIVLGDNGTANFANGQLTDISSTDSNGFDDTITLGNGLNIALGAGGNDTITGGNNKNIFGGDNGMATFDSNGNLVSFTDGGTNGDDILNAGAGNNVIIGGGGNDTITAGAGNNVLIGDEGTATFNAGGFLINITSSNASNAGNDTIIAGNGTNVIIGGSGHDIITLGIGNAYVIGDNGNASFSATGIIFNITTSDSGFGDADTITGSSGNDVIFGGVGSDIINVNDYGDVIVGDNGNANFDSAGRLTSVSTSDASIGSADTITTGIGSNVVLGGAGADTIQAGNGNNIILGDCGNVSFLTSTGKSILLNINSTDASVGGGDNITVGNGRNIVFGGAGSDTINSGAGFNILVGDSGRASFDSSGLLLNIATSDAAFGSADQITSTDGRSVILGGAGADNIRTGQGDSVIIGDNGTATFVSAGGSPSSIGNIVFSNDGILTYASTTDPTIGDNDVIVAGSGNNVILGGIGADQISTGDRNNVIIGDNGNATFDNTGVLILIQSSDASLPGAYDDIIVAGRGSNTVIGGNGADSIQTGTGLGTDIILGDNGKAVFDSTLGASILRDIISTDTSIGGNDLITAGNGFNVIVGGFGADHILGGDNTDVVLGDNGHGVFNATGILTFITTIDPAIGGNDYIDTGSGNNTVLGGTGADQIFSKGGTDVIVGDNGNATFTNTGLLTFITTSDVLSGGDDIIHAGDGFNTVLGGSGADQIIGGANTDVVIGDNGNATFDPSSGDSILRDIISTDVSVGGDDIINVGDGSNVVLGGYGADQVTGGVDQDVVLGDNGHGIFNVQGILTYITTISPDVGGDDVINVNDGTNVVIGGIGADRINGGTGRDIVLGDNGNATFDDTGVLTLIQTSDAPVLGSYDDIIKGFAGDNVIFGGNGNDQITTLGGNDVIAGDNGVAKFDSTAGVSVIRDIISTDTGIGGDDTINAGDGNNVVIAGYGNDLVNTGVGNDIAVGDSGHAVFNAPGILTYITSISPDIGGDDVINVSDGTNVVIGGIGNDLINGGSGRDIVLGDNGNATFDDTGVLILLQTSDAAVPGNYDDIINGFAGDNVVFGGNGNDQVNTLGGNDVIAGDNAKAVFDSTHGVSVIRDFISTDPDIGGDDVINAGDGNNIVIAGCGNDLVNSGTGNDIVAGDNSHAVFNALGIMTYFTSINPEIGGDDVINVGDGNNVVIGGNGADQINGGVGRIYALGDNGNVTFDDTGVLLLMQTSDPTVPGNYNDIIHGSTGDNVIFGGNGNDRITTQGGNDVIAGDNAVANFDSTAGANILRDFISSDTAIGGDDLINAGGGNNVVFGGVGSDNIASGSGNDFVLGDNGHAVYNPSGLLTYITTISSAIGGNDVIHAGDGYNVIFGGSGNDRIFGGNGVDLVLGDNGYATFTDLGVLTYLTTTDESFGGNDFIFTFGGNDMIFGGVGNDYIDAGAGDDIVLGDFGYYNIALVNTPLVQYQIGTQLVPVAIYPHGISLLDELNGGNDTIFGGSGNDYLLGEGGNDYIDGGSQDDAIYGGYGDDILLGADGNDALIGGPGGDHLDGGNGTNILYVDLADEWSGGMDKDTIVGGPFFSTNNQLTFGLSALGAVAGQQPPGASVGARSFTSDSIFLTGSRLGILTGSTASSTGSSAGSGGQLAMSTSSSILAANQDLMISTSSLNHPRWTGSSYAPLTSEILGATPLIGIGEFLEIQWSELMAQYP